MGVSKDTILAGHQNRMNLLSNRIDRDNKSREEAMLIAIQSLSSVKQISEESLFNKKVVEFGEDILGFQKDANGNWYSSKTNQEIGDHLGYSVHPKNANTITPIILTDPKMRAMTKYYMGSGNDLKVLEDIIGTIYKLDTDPITEKTMFVGPKKAYSNNFKQFLKLSDEDKLKVVQPWAEKFKEEFYDPYVKAHAANQTYGSWGPHWIEKAGKYNIGLPSGSQTPFYPRKSSVIHKGKRVATDAISPYPGEFGDSFTLQFQTRGGRAFHVNEYELALVNMFGNEAEDWLLENAKNSQHYKATGDYPINDQTGLYELYSGGFGNLASITSSISSVANMGAAAGPLGNALAQGMGTGFMGSLGAMAGPLSIGLMAADWIGGAFGAADQAKQQRKELSRTMDQLGSTLATTYERGQEKLSDLKDLTGNKIQSFTTQLGDSIEELGSNVKTGWKKARGLISGSLEQFKENTLEDLTTNYTSQIRDLIKTSDMQFDDIAQGRQDDMMDTKFQIGELKRQFDDLEDDTKWYNNLI
tara:strand:+ start:815 stop:2401 length:1587 start_codon:yes stop_codon:yes gene_type:complete